MTMLKRILTFLILIACSFNFAQAQTVDQILDSGKNFQVVYEGPSFVLSPRASRLIELGTVQRDVKTIVEGRFRNTEKVVTTDITCVLDVTNQTEFNFELRSGDVFPLDRTLWRTPLSIDGPSRVTHGLGGITSDEPNNNNRRFSGILFSIGSKVNITEDVTPAITTVEDFKEWCGDLKIEAVDNGLETIRLTK